VRALVSFCCLTIALAIGALSGSAYGETKTKVFVHTDARMEKLTPEKKRDLTDSMVDLREQIQKRREIEITTERSQANLLVTILDRRIEVNRSGETKYFGYTQTHYESRYVLSFRVEARTVAFESETALAGAFVTWKRVASVLSKDIEQWARDHREDMLEPSDR
jgi:hypothetical protein